MTDLVIRYTIQLAFSGLILWGFVYYFSRYRRINVKMVVGKDNYKLGEEIQGIIKLNIKKQLTVQSITVQLQGRGKYVETHQRRSNKKIIDFFEKEYSIEGTNNYLKGSEPNFNFSIKIPDMSSLNGEGREIMKTGMSMGGFMNDPVDNYKGVLYFWDIRTTVKVGKMSFSSYKALTIS